MEFVIKVWPQRDSLWRKVVNKDMVMNGVTGPSGWVRVLVVYVFGSILERAVDIFSDSSILSLVAVSKFVLGMTGGVGMGFLRMHF